jgi:serine/threonine protein kinase
MESYEPGSVFGGYTIEGLIAGGGMGRVYAARHEVYGNVVALKVLHPQLHADDSWRQRFNEEGLVGTQLKHPHILSARELVEHDDRVALVLDLVSGGQTLDKVIGREFREGLPLVEALQVFLTILQGMDYLHTKEIVHGDIKPENVLVEGEYRRPDTWSAKVTDFGTVALIANPVTIDGRAAVVATPRYASPEHMFGVDQIEFRSDIYSLGLLLHFLLTGRHVSVAKNVTQAAEAVLMPVPVVMLVDQPEIVIALFKRACAVNPDHRFQTCRDLALGVRAVLDSVGAVLELDDVAADLATEVDDDRVRLKEELAAREDAELQASYAEETEVELGAVLGEEPDADEVATDIGAAEAPLPPDSPVPPPVRSEPVELEERAAPLVEVVPPPHPDEDEPEKTVARPKAPAVASEETTPFWVWIAVAVSLFVILVVLVMNFPS